MKPYNKKSQEDEKHPNNKDMTCFNCKKQGHISMKCPLKTNGPKLARAVHETADGKQEPAATANLEDLEDSSSDTGEAKGKTSDGEQDSDYKSLLDDASSVDLADWTAAARLLLDKDEDNDVGVHNEKSWSARIVTGEDPLAGPSSRRATEPPEEQIAFHHRATKDLRVKEGTKRNFKSSGVLEGLMKIGELKARVLLDSGSTLDMILANYAAVMKLEMFQLKKPVKLQMATAGSGSSINFGACTEIQIGELCQKRYFDIVNLDRYDAILGIPFLKENQVLLNFTGNGSFKINSRWFPVGSAKPKTHFSKQGGESSRPSDIQRSSERM
jgi:hypothetical protein